MTLLTLQEIKKIAEKIDAYSYVQKQTISGEIKKLVCRQHYDDLDNKRKLKFYERETTRKSKK